MKRLLHAPIHPRKIVGGIAEPGDNQHDHRQIKAKDACPNSAVCVCVCWVAEMGRRERHRPDPYLPAAAHKKTDKTETGKIC